MERKINIRFKNGGGYNFSITEINTEYFVIDNNDRLIEEVFVYGYEVNDFHILTKDYIYTLNISATRELHRKMLEQEGRIKELEDRLG
jgi:FKBP-type peptidyl-prolyl cis-trans isomerase 2